MEKGGMIKNITNDNNISISSLGGKHHQQQGDYLKAIFYTSGAVFVIFINSMTIVSYFLRKKSKRGIPDLFMLSLAISSILTMLSVVLILAFIRATGNESYEGIQALCYIQVYFGTMLRMLDVSITTAIMIDRFLALYKPLLYRVKFKFSHGKVVCAVLWIESALIAMLPLVGFGRISMHSFCTADWTSDIAYIVLIIAYISFGIVLFSYVGIFRAISGLVSRQETMKKSQSLSYMSPRAHHKTVYSNENIEVFEIESPTLYSQQNQSSTHNLAVSSQTTKSSLSTDDIQNNPATFNSSNPSKRNRVSWVDDEPSFSVNDGIKLQPPFHLLPDLVKSSEKSRLPSSDNQYHHRRAFQRKQPLSKRAEFTMRKIPFTISEHFNKKRTRRNNTTNKLSSLSSSSSSSSPSSLKDFRTESLRFAKIMGVVVFLFYVSWIPLAVSFLNLQ